MLTADKVLSVYSGTAHRCCCGCSGKHRHNPLFQERSKVTDEECSQKAITRMVNLYNKAPEDWVDEGGHLLLETPTRWKIIYKAEFSSAVVRILPESKQSKPS